MFKNIGKTILVVLSLLVLSLILVIAFISPITKYLIEKYDTKYSGREITMDYAYVNPFSGFVHLSGLKIYQPKSDSVLLSAKGVSAGISIHKLWSKNYEINSIVLDEPKGIVLQEKNNFNFDDIIRLFSSKDTSTTKAPIHLSILKINIVNGEFYFTQKEIPINYFIKKVNFESSGYQWNSDTTSFTFSFKAGPTGSDVKGNLSLDHKTLNYRYSILVKKLDFGIANQYLKDIVNYGRLSGNADLDLKAKGNFSDKENASTTGLISVNDFHLGKDSLEDYVSFKKLVLSLKDASPKKRIFLMDSVWINEPYLKYERYDHLDNLEMMLGKNSVNFTKARADHEKFNLVIELLKYNDIISEAFFKSYYKINKLVVLKGNVKFNDYSLNEKFSVSLHPLYLRADSIDKNHEHVKFVLKTGLAPYGNANIVFNINPKAKKEFHINYHLQKIPATLFNPYLISFTAFPMERGSVDVKGNWNVKNGLINSTNHLVIIDPRLGNRIRNDGVKWIPMKLIMALIRERGNVIDYEIPITGNLKHPNFHWNDVVMDMIKNIHIKPPTLPYALEVSETENTIEESYVIEWGLRSSALPNDQVKFLKKIAKFLKNNPLASLSVLPITYLEKEKEQMLFFETKKKYFLHLKKQTLLSRSDSIAVEKLSIKDSLLLRYLNKHLNTAMMFTIQQKCYAFVNSNILHAKMNHLIKERQKLFLSFFLENNTFAQVKIQTNKNMIPFNGFSYYKINYKGLTPESLVSASKLLDKMNTEGPRKKYNKRRKNNSEASPTSKKNN